MAAIVLTDLEMKTRRVSISVILTTDKKTDTEKGKVTCPELHSSTES